MTDAEDETPDQPLNREERRARRFGRANHGDPHTVPERKNNPAFGTGDDAGAYAGRPDQDVVELAGAGTGGATESDERVPEHEGQHRGNQPNS